MRYYNTPVILNQEKNPVYYKNTLGKNSIPKRSQCIEL